MDNRTQLFSVVSDPIELEHVAADLFVPAGKYTHGHGIALTLLDGSIVVYRYSAPVARCYSLNDAYEELAARLGVH